MTHANTASAAHTRAAVPLSVWGQSVIIVVGSFASMLASTIVNPALPEFATELHATTASVQWAATGYLLALAAGVPVSGWLSRRIGATRLWLLGVALFAAFAAVSALAGSVQILLVGRVLQGLAGGLLVPAGQTILALTAGRQNLGKILSTTGVAIVVAPTLGTTLGGVLVDHLGTAWLSWLSVPLAAIAFFTGLRWLPRVATSPAGRLDVAGLVLVLCGLPALMYGISALPDASGLSSDSADAWTCAGIVLLAAFVIRELRAKTPLLRIRLFGHGIFASGAAVMLFGGAVNFGAQIVLPLYFTQTRGESLLAAGLLIVPQVIGTAIGFPIAGRLADRYGAGRLVFAGAGITALATLPLALGGAHTSYIWLGAVLAVRGLGVALSTIPAMTAGIAAVDRDHVPDATPILNMLQRIGGSVGTAVLAVVYAANLDGADGSDDSLNAFHVASWWLFGAAALLAVLAGILTRSEQRAER